MANAFKNNVWVLDTTGTIASGDQAAGGYDRVRVVALRWVVTTGGVVGDNCQIRDDTAGTVLWEAVVTAVGAGGEFQHESQFPEGLELRAADTTGLHLTIDRGTLYVYLDT